MFTIEPPPESLISGAHEGRPEPATHPSSSHPVMVTSADTPAASASLSTLTAHIRGAFGGRVDWRVQEFPLQTPDIAGCHRTCSAPSHGETPASDPGLGNT